MDNTIDMLPSLSSKIIAQNPQVQEQRCRICYEESKPLITLCDCSGSIAYVHEDCILDWITKKMESSQTVEIPRCQICQATYSARLKIGRKKICPKLLLRKIKEQKLRDFLLTLAFLIGTIVAVIVSSKGIFALSRAILTFSSPTVDSTTGQSNESQGFLVFMFKNIVFPILFVCSAVSYGKKKLKIIEESKVQIVEVTLNPKLIMK